MIKCFPAKTDSINELVSFTEQNLANKKFNKKLIYEYRLLVEEIAIKLVENAKENAEISVQIYRRLGSLNIKIGCPGKAIYLGAEDETDFGGYILDEFSDYLRQSYSSGINYITFSSSSSNDFFLLSAIAVVASVITGLVINSVCSGTQINWINHNILSPLIIIFTNFMQTLAMPVAFFSLSSFIIALQLSFVKNKRMLHLALRYLLSSLAAMGIGVLFWYIYGKAGIHFDLTAFKIDRNNILGGTLREFFLNSVPTNIIEPLMMINPIPLLIIALLVGYSASHLFGKEGKTARHAIRSANALFCRMMNVVYGFIPITLFFAHLYNLLEYGYNYESGLFLFILITIPPILTVFIVYLIQLRLNGISPFSFLKEYKDVLWENLKIGSNIQAFPYNKRMIYRRTKIQRDILDDGLKLGSLMNMDGNCVIVAFYIMMLITSVQIDLSIVQCFGMAIIFILISFSVPNQPGSFLLGMIVLMTYAGISGELYADMLIIEALLGKLYSFLNATGDIVAMVIEAKKIERGCRI